MLVYTKYLLVSYLFMVVLFLLSHSLKRILDSSLDVFFFLSICFISIVSVYASFTTGFSTVMLFSMLIVFFLFMRRIPANIKGVSQTRRIKDDFVYFIIALGTFSFFSLFSLCSLYTDDILIGVTLGDHSFHSQLAMFLNDKGKETLDWNFFDGSEVTVMPYHYFEAWFVALIGKFSDLNYVNITRLICLPFFNTLTVLGVISILKSINVKSTYYWFAVLLVFISGVYFYEGYGLSFFGFADKFSFNSFDNPWGLRLTVSYFIYLNSIYLLMKNRVYESLSFLLFLPVFNISTLPIIIPSIMILYFVYAIRHGSALVKYLTFRNVIYYSVPLLLLLFIGWFYSTGDGTELEKVVEMKSIYESIAEILTYTRLIVNLEQVVYGFILYSPFIIMLGVYFRKKLGFLKVRKIKIGMLLLVLIMLFSFTTAQILWNEFGGYHVMFFNILPILNIGSFFILILFCEEILNKRLKWIGFSILIMTSTIFIGRTLNNLVQEKSKFELEYEQTFISDLVESRNAFSGNGVIFEEVERYGHLGDGAQYNPYVFTHSYVLFSVSDSVHMCSLNYNEVDNLKSKTAWKRKFYKMDPFVNYLIKNKVEDVGMPNDSMRLQFIQEYNVKYISVGPGVNLDSIYRPLVEREIISEKNDIKIYILKG